MGPLNDMICFISALTVDIKLTFCCGTCDMSTLVGMTRHNIYIIQILEYKKVAS